MFWWMVTLILFLVWMAGFDLAGLFVLAFLFIIMLLGSLAGVDRRRHRHPTHRTYYSNPPMDPVR